MLNDKIKLRVSLFVKQILENDAQEFGYIKKDDMPNINALLNKILPVLFFLKKQRRELLHLYAEELSIKTINGANMILNATNSIFERIYFSDEELEDLTEEIWLRPSKSNQTIFCEIDEEESKITQKSTSQYIRELLNEYSRFPQYKREKIAFWDELERVLEAKNNMRLLRVGCDGLAHKVFVISVMYGYLYDQEIYIIYYDIEKKFIGAFDLCDVKDLYLLRERFKPFERLKEKAQKYMNDCMWLDDKKIVVEE